MPEERGRGLHARVRASVHYYNDESGRARLSYSCQGLRVRIRPKPDRHDLVSGWSDRLKPAIRTALSLSRDCFALPLLATGRPAIARSAARKQSRPKA